MDIVVIYTTFGVWSMCGWCRKFNTTFGEEDV